MPFALILLGLILVIAGARNKTTELGTLLAGDFSGPGSFWQWFGAIGIVGSLGYFEQLRTVSRLFLGMIVLAMLLSDQGFFAKLQAALATIGTPTPAPEAAVGAASADPGAASTGPVQPKQTDTPLPSDLAIPSGAQGKVSTVEQLQAWIAALPKTAATGPSQEHPYIAEGQLNNNFNDYMNRNVGVPFTQGSGWGAEMGQGMLQLFGLSK